MKKYRTDLHSGTVKYLHLFCPKSSLEILQRRCWALVHNIKHTKCLLAWKSEINRQFCSIKSHRWINVLVQSLWRWALSPLDYCYCRLKTANKQDAQRTDLQPSGGPHLHQHHTQRLCLRRQVRNLGWNKAGGHKEMSVVYLCWPIAPSYMSPNAGDGGRGVVESQPMSTAVHITWQGTQINFGDLTPYLEQIGMRPNFIAKETA